MNKEEILELRDNMYPKGELMLFTDNDKLYNERNSHCSILWDDNLELVHVIRTNATNYYQLEKRPLNIESFGYDVIQYMSCSTDEKGVKDFLEKLKTKGLVDDTKIKEILDSFKDILPMSTIQTYE